MSISLPPFLRAKAVCLALILSCGALAQGSTNLALQRPVEASSQNSLNDWAVHAVDGAISNSLSRWVTALNEPYPHWIEIDLGGEGYVLDQLRFWTGHGGTYGYPITDFRLQYWDGSAWVDILTRSDDPNTGAFDATFSPTDVTRRVRWVAEAGSVDSVVRLYEIETWGAPHPVAVVGESPAHGSTVVDPAADLVLTFAAPVQAVDTSGVQVIDAGGNPVGGAVSVAGNSLTVAGASLAHGGSYTVKVPAGAVELVASPGTVNGPIFWEFAVAPAAPQLASAPKKGDDLVADLVYTFDRDITLIDASGIELTWLDDGTAVTGVGASVVNGNQLAVSHDPFVAERTLSITIPAGALEGVLNAVANERIERVYHTAEYALFYADFYDGMDGFATATELGEVSVNARNWARKTDTPGRQGPGGDYRFLETSHLGGGDFVVSPPVTLVAGERYSLQVIAETQGDLEVNLSAERNVSALTPVGTIPTTTTEAYKEFRPVREVNFTAPESGTQYLLIQNYPNNHPWAEQRIDNLSFVREVSPATLITSPADGSTYLESDSIPVEIKAFGVTGTIETVEIYDDDTLLTTLTEAPYTWDWAEHIPGERALRVLVTDSRGSVTERSVNVTVTFDDGSLFPFISWDFNSGSQGWTSTGGGTPKDGGEDDYWWINGSASAGLYYSSPEVFLFAGETYTFTFEAGGNSTTRYWGFEALTAPGYPQNPDPQVLHEITNTRYVRSEYAQEFTVPADGAYHLTLYDTSLGGRAELRFDNFFLIGNFNSIPQVAIIGSETTLETVTGAVVNLTAEAIDLDGTVTRVEYFDGGTKIGESTEAPYAVAWSGFASGTHQIVARAHDDRSGFADSPPYEVIAHPNPLSMGTLLGDGDSGDAVRGLAYQADGTLVMGAHADPTGFAGVSPVYLNGAQAGDLGCVVRLSEDGTAVLSVTVVGESVFDLSLDDSGHIYAAAASDGVVVLNPAASAVEWSADYAKNAHRIDAGPSGYFAAILAPSTDPGEAKLSSAEVVVYDPARTLLGTHGATSTYTQDVAIDEASATVITCGYKNVIAQTDAQGEPVDIPVYRGRSYGGTQKYVGYDWASSEATGGDRWLNKFDNNMADTRAYRCIIGDDGFLYIGMEQDGGNSPTRYDPFDLQTAVTVVGGDAYHEFFATGTVPKVFIGRYNPADGSYILGQRQTNRLSSGSDNTLRIKSGGLHVDAVGRIHFAAACASGLPVTVDFHPGQYTGGAYYMIWSPDMAVREFVSRTARYGSHYALAVSPAGMVAFGGDLTDDGFFTVTDNAWQDTPGAYSEGTLYVGDFRPFYRYQAGVHPRLFFNEADIADLRDRITREPYLSMYNRLVANLTDPDILDHVDIYHESTYALEKAFLYILTGDDAWAGQARGHVETILNRESAPWADPSLKGLTSYMLGSKVAVVYDWCVNSPSWDNTFDFIVSQALYDMGEMIVETGGTEQNPSPASNWQGSRGSSGGLCLLATDHAFDPALLDSAYGRVSNYLNQLFIGGQTRGWNPEGLGYTYYPFGNFVGPFGIAMARQDPARDLKDFTAMQWAYWTIYATASTALNVFDHGGVKPDWTNDNAHIGGEGTYGQAFYFLPDSLKPGAKWAYDRLQGAQSPSQRWDAFRSGPIWSILYYPEDLPAVDPAEIWDWHRGSDDSEGLGVFTFRDKYAYGAGDDFLAQFKVRRYEAGGHNGPDGLGIRIIGAGVPWVIGGGRDDPGKKMGQATLYTTFPSASVTTNLNTGSLSGTPLVMPDGGGHAIAEMAINNVGTQDHKRWFVASYDSASTGADATYIIADTSLNGSYWHLPTYLQNSISISGNTFTVTGENGATLKGTVLYPAGAVITTGTMERGSTYLSDPLVEDNAYINFATPDGDCLVVLTVQKSGTHPAVSMVSGTVADATVQVGTLQVTLQDSDVLYNGAPYSAPDATVTFDDGGHGTLGGATVQTVPYGGSAIEPVVSADSGYLFTGWNKAFDKVVKSMTVTALYAIDAGLTHRESWLDGYGLPLDGTGEGADLYDGDHDGIPLILEYVLKGHPGNPDNHILPELHLEWIDGEPYMEIHYNQPEGGTGTRGFDYRVEGITVAVETGPGLGADDWTVESGHFSLISASPIGDGWERVVLRATSPLVTREFFRLKVTR